MKKVVIIIIVLALIGATCLNAQDLDVFQTNISWNYHGMNYQPNELGNGWQIKPEFRYYFLELSYGTFVPNKTNLTYQNEFLVGAYFTPTWQNEWKRDSISELPKIIEGLPENGGIQKFDFGLSFKYILNPMLFLTLDAGMSIKSSSIRNGVNDSVPRYPYYQSAPVKLELLYSDDYFRVFNRIKLSLEMENSFKGYRAFKSGEKFFIDTVVMAPEKFFSAGLECVIFSPTVGNAVIDLSLINRYCRFKGGEDLFGLPGNDPNEWNYEVGFGVGLRRLEKLDEAIKAEVLFGYYGFTVGAKAELSSLYDLIIKP